MDFTLKEIRKITKKHLLSYEGVQQIYDDLAYNILTQAELGKTDLLIYLTKYNDQENIWCALKALELDGFKLTSSKITKTININWRE